MRPIRGWTFRAAALLGAALAIALAGGAASNAARAGAEQRDRGRPIYEASCAQGQCHGADGVGQPPRIWPAVGADFQRRNPNAQVIFDVIRSGEEPELRALADQQIYDAVAWELWLNGVDLGPTELSAQNAAAIGSGPAARPLALAPPLDLAPFGVPPPTPSFYNQALSTSDEAVRRGANDRLLLRVAQAATVDRLGEQAAADGRVFAVAVLFVVGRGPDPVAVDPAFVRLEDDGGALYEALPYRIPHAIDTFHRRDVDAEHGLAGILAFDLPSAIRPVALRYADPAAPELRVPL